MTTTSTPELMPDEIWTIHEGYAYSDDGKCFYTGNQINPDDVSYTRTDLYTAAYAERDALLAGAVAGCRDGAEVVIDLKTAKALIEICERAAHTERNHEPNQ